METFVETNRSLEKQENLIEVCLRKMIQLEPYKEQYVYSLLDYYGKTKDLQKLAVLFQDIKEKWVGELGVDIPKELQELYVEYIM